ncbi:ATP-binding protein [Actinosynnema sp. NPDC020468]|uniref:ATP-binding protein n=1 Tax=Actinosynnema sp. NPDC020468 TaxID=3154488 RepID=UPI0034079A89
MSLDELLTLTVQREPDVFLLRRHGREVAGVVGFEGQDQIRVATALSDLGRELVRRTTPSTVVFRLRGSPRSALVIHVDTTDTDGPGWDTVRRLMDEVHTTDDGVTLEKALAHPAPADPAELRRALTSQTPTDALDELRAQNQELLVTLEDLERKRKELVRLNEELEDTNRGVVALHKELSDELEQTNQGVVALYGELEEKTTQLRLAGEARTRFWSNISHELRSPVNSVVGLTRLLVAPGADPLTPEQKRQVDLINDAGTTLLDLVNELLDTAKAESGNLRARLAPVDLPLVLAQLRGGSQPLVRPGVELVVEPPPVTSAVTDEVMLLRVLRNLLSNALKFTERGRVRLEVHLDEDPGTLRFVVSDTGIGIPPEEQERIFEDFYQVPGRLQVGASGTGLGLPYARKLAEILGGDLSLTSTPGQGTEVTLALPLQERDDPPVAVALVVEADDAVRARLVAALVGLAEVVVESTDGRDALAKVRDRPDLVFLAADAPLVGGTEVLGVLRADPELRGVPVVVVGREIDAGLERTASGLAAAILPTAAIAAETVRQSVRVARTVARRTERS